jgi:hypothetical protein
MALRYPRKARFGDGKRPAAKRGRNLRKGEPETLRELFAWTLKMPMSIGRIGAEGIPNPRIRRQLLAVFLAVNFIMALLEVYVEDVETIAKEAFNNPTGVWALVAVAVMFVAQGLVVLLVSASLTVAANLVGWWVSFKPVLAGFVYVQILIVLVYLIFGGVGIVPALLLGSEVPVSIAVTFAEWVSLAITATYLMGLFDKGFWLSMILGAIAFYGAVFGMALIAILAVVGLQACGVPVG